MIENYDLLLSEFQEKVFKLFAEADLNEEQVTQRLNTKLSAVKKAKACIKKQLPLNVYKLYFDKRGRSERQGKRRIVRVRLEGTKSDSIDALKKRLGDLI